MERSSDPHHSTADLLSWPQIHHSSAANPSNQPSDDIGDVLGGGGRTTNKEAKSLNKNVSYRKNCCGHKLKEMTGSDIFSDNGNVTNGDPTHTSRIHYHHDQDSQISFSGEENNNAAATPKKPTTTSSPEAAKLKELGRSVQTQADSKSKKKQLSNSKTKAITGRDIFASPPPPPATKQQVKGNNNMEESAKASNGQSCNSEEHVVKSSRKIHNNPRFQQLTSNGIFKSDKIPPGYSEKMHSSAKSREMRGNNIFADGKSEYRDYYGGARRPPGGESSLSLV
ncbi:uncharacterized protein LOC106446403 isoform X2 [Brassica napus]|uniref:(rape) hypothetical protein n=1 Tax=Brassica napus TaxID=3708 RepID=A0A817AUJ0_BRANA|nr:uncharacterized protein LOC106446403 isoform X2 [Brassica napus]CAF2276712.1 unnamed protein product [Brassica napus]